MWWIIPDKVRIYYHNNTDPSRAYPFNTDQIAIRAIIWARTPTGYYAYCGMPFRLNPESNGHWFDNDGYWYETGRSGDLIPNPNGSESWQNHQWPRLDPQTIIHRWPGPPLNFTWYRIQPAVDKETQLTERHKYVVDNTVYRCYYYPSYEQLPINGWGIDSLPLQPGSSRYIVHVTWTDEKGRMRLLRSLAPTPGDWAPRDIDHEQAILTRTWSQNCDEPPDTVGPEEFAVRISVRDMNATSPNPRKQEYLRWLTAYLNTPYSYGGEWFGGWADDKYNTYPGGAYELDIQNHYGIDCSGLVSCGARWAGYNWNPWRRRTSTIPYSGIDDPNNNLQPGDILIYPGHHVVTVYRYIPGHLSISDSQIIEAVGGNIDRTWIRSNVNIQRDYLYRGYIPGELIWYSQ
jgi:cell wall-associated NlpC family hydrolase